MKNIEIKQIIDGKLAVVIGGISQYDLPLGMAKTFLNLDNMLYFKTYKLDENYDNNIGITRKIIGNSNGKSIFVDGLPEENEFLELINIHNYYWEFKIPENTQVISLFFKNEIVWNLYFLHGGEYQKFMRILTEKK